MKSIAEMREESIQWHMKRVQAELAKPHIKNERSVRTKKCMCGAEDIPINFKYCVVCREIAHEKRWRANYKKNREFIRKYQKGYRDAVRLAKELKHQPQ